jgi:hypothetical protein
VATAGLVVAGETNPTVYSLASAYVGFEAAVAFNDFVANYSKVVSVADVLDKGKVPEDLDLNAHCALIDKLGASGRLDGEVTEKVRVNLGAYFLSLPSEPAMKLWSVVGQTNAELAIALHSTEVKGKSIGAYLVEILTGEEIS